MKDRMALAMIEGAKAALAHLCKRVVEAAQERFAIVFRLRPERRRDRILERRKLGRSEDPDIVDAEFDETVQFTPEPRAIAIFRIGPEVGRVPHVRASIAVWATADREASPIAANELRAWRDTKRTCGAPGKDYGRR